jgi:uncharacterized membrane protein (UPF0136 family)
MKKATGKQTDSLAGIKIAAFLMMLFGFAEVVTGVTHRFFVLTTDTSQLATYVGVIIGLLYFVSGFLILKGRKWAAVLAIALLIVHVLGRVFMVVMGLYRVDTIPQILGIVIGTAIAVYLAGYVCLKLKSFK